MKKRKVEMVRVYEIEYEHEAHLQELTEKLKTSQIDELGGAGVAPNGQVSSYRCRWLPGEGGDV